MLSQGLSEGSGANQQHQHVTGLMRRTTFSSEALRSRLHAQFGLEGRDFLARQPPVSPPSFGKRL